MEADKQEIEEPSTMEEVKKQEMEVSIENVPPQQPSTSISSRQILKDILLKGGIEEDTQHPNLDDKQNKFNRWYTILSEAELVNKVCLSFSKLALIFFLLASHLFYLRI